MAPFYHVAPTAARHLIERDGLIPNSPTQTFDQFQPREGVHLFSSPEHAHEWADQFADLYPEVPEGHPSHNPDEVDEFGGHPVADIWESHADLPVEQDPRLDNGLITNRAVPSNSLRRIDSYRVSDMSKHKFGVCPHCYTDLEKNYLRDEFGEDAGSSEPLICPECDPPESRLGSVQTNYQDTREGAVEPLEPYDPKWEQGECGPYAERMMNRYPHLSFGVAGTKHENGWWPQHYFAHDDEHAYDIRGKTPLADIHNQWDVVELGQPIEHWRDWDVQTDLHTREGALARRDWGYHAAPAHHHDQIMRDGLIMGQSASNDEEGDQPAGVYFWNDPYDAGEFYHAEDRPRNLYRVNLSGLPVHEDPMLPHAAVYVPSHIEPERIQPHGDTSIYAPHVARIANIEQSMLSAMPDVSDIAQDGECYDVAQGVQSRWPHLKADSGFFIKEDGHPADHAWNRAENGSIVDATSSQFGHEHVIDPSHPLHGRYISFEHQPEEAQAIAHSLGHHDDPAAYVGVCRECDKL